MQAQNVLYRLFSSNSININHEETYILRRTSAAESSHGIVTKPFITNLYSCKRINLLFLTISKSGENLQASENHLVEFPVWWFPYVEHKKRKIEDDFFSFSPGSELSLILFGKKLQLSEAHFGAKIEFSGFCWRALSKR